MEWLVLAAAACLTVSYFGGYFLIITTIGAHSRLLDKIAFALLLCKVLGTRYNMKEFLILFGLSFLAYVTYRASGNIGMIWNILMIFSLKNVDLKKLFRVSLFSLIFAAAVVAVCSLQGLGGPVKIVQDYGRGGVETRYCFGFIHPNQWAHAMFMIILLSVLGFWEKMDWKLLLFLAAVNGIVYWYSVSRTGLLAGMVLLFLAFLFRYAKKMMHTFWMKLLLLAGVIAAWIFPLAAMADHAAGRFLTAVGDRFLTGRLELSKAYFDHYGTSLWGEKIEDVLVAQGYGDVVLDVGPLRFLLENGWIWFCLLFCAMCLAFWYMMRKNKDEAVIAMLCISLYGLNEYIAMGRVPANVAVYFIALWFWESCAKPLLPRLRKN